MVLNVSCLKVTKVSSTTAVCVPAPLNANELHLSSPTSPATRALPDVSGLRGRGQEAMQIILPGRTEPEQPVWAPFYQFVGCREDKSFLILKGPGEVLKLIYYCTIQSKSNGQ